MNLFNFFSRHRRQRETYMQMLRRHTGEVEVFRAKCPHIRQVIWNLEETSPIWMCRDCDAILRKATKEEVKRQVMVEREKVRKSLRELDR